MKLGIVVYDGFDDLDAIGPYEVLRHAAERGADLEVKLVTRTPSPSVRSSHGLTLVPHGTLDEAFDWLMVAGGRWAQRGTVGAWGEIQRGDLPRALAEKRAHGTGMAAICTGTMLLAAAGITRNRRATTHHVALDALRAEGAYVVEARVVDDGDLVTCGGVTSGIDLALWFVERHFGADRAASIARTLEHERSTDIVQPQEPSLAAGRLARTPQAPYYAVIFSAVRRPGDHGYGATASRMEELARAQPGFLGIESVGDRERVEITVSYWASLDAVAAWRNHPEHLEAQRRGKETWYSAYEIRVARVERAYRLPA